MKLPRPRPSYDSQDEALTRSAIEQADAQNLKRGQTIELPPGVGLIMTSPGGLRFQMGVSDAGVTTWTAL
jgi:hypothetical protein